MAQNVNNMQSISLYEKKIQKKLKEEATKVAIQKRKKICEQYKLSAQATTLPFKNLTLGTISPKKSPQMPPNPLQGGLVYGNVTKVSFQNLQIFYISGFGGRNYTFQKQLFFIKLKKPKNKGRGLKSWGIVENGLYFENVRKKPTKLMLGFKNGSGKTKQTFGAH